MLRQLAADDPRFRVLTFHAGLNILVADVTPGSRSTDSRNSAGKSSVIELLHFLLGGSVERSLPAKPPLRDIEFSLTMDWPNLAEPLQVDRRASHGGWVRLQPLPPDADRDDLGTGYVKVTEWQNLIERHLFRLESPVGISGRSLLSFLIRRAGSHAYNTAVRSFSQQNAAVAIANLAYLFGLDWQLADRYRQLQQRDSTRAQVQKAAGDPLLGRIIGKIADLRGEIALAERRVAELEQQVSAFRVVPEYENQRQQADEIDQQIRQLRNRDAVDRRNLQDLQTALEEATDPDTDYLVPAFAELNVLMSDQVVKRFEEVEAFHQSVIRNRRDYLQDEATALRLRLADSEAVRERLGDQLASTLRTLQEGGALDALTQLQQILGQERAVLDALRHRYEAAHALESTRRDIAQARLTLQQEVDRDIEARRTFVDEATVLFAEFARRLYGPDRIAYLKFEATGKSFTIEPHIDSDSSMGIGSMVIFCFDLAMSVLAHRGGRAPDFLVHDSHLFDGVDERQLAAALTLAAEVMARERMQYIVTINSDDLEKAQRRGFDPVPHLLPQRLTDQFEAGGLFGFRFK